MQYACTKNYLVSSRANWQASALIGSFHIPERSSHPAPTSGPNVTRRIFPRVSVIRLGTTLVFTILAREHHVYTRVTLQ